MSTADATIIVSLVIVFSQGLGALVNNRRYSSLEKVVQKVRERLIRVETILRQGRGLPPFEEGDWQ